MNETKKKATVETQESLKEGMSSYFKGVKAEWGKVTWPERKQVIAETVIVLGVVFFFTALVYLIDILFRGLFSLIPSTG